MRLTLSALILFAGFSPLAHADEKNLIRIACSRAIVLAGVAATVVGIGGLIAMKRADPERATTSHLFFIRFEDRRAPTPARSLDELPVDKHRIDGWGEPIHRAILRPGEIELRSAGPDRTLNTPDDLTLQYKI